MTSLFHHHGSLNVDPIISFSQSGFATACLRPSCRRDAMRCLAGVMLSHSARADVHYRFPRAARTTVNASFHLRAFAIIDTRTAVAHFDTVLVIDSFQSAEHAVCSLPFLAVAR